MVSFVHYWASPYQFMRIVRYLNPIFASLALVLFVSGMYMAFFASPADYQQGNSVRIMYVHVPSAYMATLIYGAMAVAGFVYFIWKHLLAEIFARAAAPVGIVFTSICLITGSLWGKPIWGTWWVWDARLTSVFILFFLYLAYILFTTSFTHYQGRRMALILVMIGAVNLPIIKFSVNWWQTLHQGASLFRAGGPSIDNSFLVPLFLMLGFVTCLAAWLILQRIEMILLCDKLRYRAIAKELGEEG